MTKDKAKKLAKALGLVITEKKNVAGGVDEKGFRHKVNSTDGQDCIRKRIWELLDRLKLLYNLHRDEGQSKIRINEKVSYKELWNSDLFTDDKLSVKEQDLLTWLDEKEKK